jgi:hypothetical protein
MNTETTENLTIGKHNLEVKVLELNQSDLRFYPENPRVYSVLNQNGEEPQQDEIEKYMCNLDHVKQLKISIESNGGLIDPLIVRGGDYTVLEGNSRLAAYRLLCLSNPIKWGKVKCKVLPADINESIIFTLLGQYHIVGRKDWEPFEQASYLYRRKQHTRLPIASMAIELGISKQKAEKMVEVIEFMVEHDDMNKRHWSHYEEYLKNAALKKYRETSSELDETIVNSIKSEEVQEAHDIRKLGSVAKVGDKQSKKLMAKVASKELSIYDAYERMAESGKFDDVVKRLNTFRNLIMEESFEKQLVATQEVRQKALFEIKKIINRLESINKDIKE